MGKLPGTLTGRTAQIKDESESLHQVGEIPRSEQPQRNWGGHQKFPRLLGDSGGVRQGHDDDPEQDHF